MRTQGSEGSRNMHRCPEVNRSRTIVWGQSLTSYFDSTSMSVLREGEIRGALGRRCWQARAFLNFPERGFYAFILSYVLHAQKDH